MQLDPHYTLHIPPPQFEILSSPVQRHLDPNIKRCDSLEQPTMACQHRFMTEHEDENEACDICNTTVKRVWTCDKCGIFLCPRCKAVRSAGHKS